MDAIEFIKEYFRLCEAHEDCVDCPFTKEETDVPCDLISKNAEKIVSIVKQWAEEHPQKTIMQDFFEKFPNAPRTKTGEPMMCPYNCGYGSFCCEQANGTCYNCWNRPLEES